MKSIYEASVAYGRENQGTVNIEDYQAGANYVLGEIEKELQRRMLEDYNQGAEEDEVAQGCMAAMIMFVRQLKK